MKKGILFLLIVFFSLSVIAQTKLDSVQQLEEVVLKADRYLKTFTNTQKVQTLKDTVFSRSAPSLTQLLNYNSTLYFKENGLGMVSSPSFRGTTAQQTAVAWNGININSQFNGQTDFNTINIRNFDGVSIRSGGGSVLYGSGAIGGSIHLNNNISFNEGFNNSVYANYGSFNTLDVGVKSGFSSKQFSVDVAVSRSSSDNDYDYVDSDKTNLNGAFYNQSISANFGYKINAKNILKFYSYLYDGEREFSFIFPSETPTKYQDLNSRNMLEWNGVYGKFVSTLKLAYLTENYKYFANSNLDTYSFGKAKTLIGKYDLSYRVFKDAMLQGVVDITNTSGEGSSIDNNKRTISSFSLLYKQQVKSFFYEATIRKEVTNNYDSPLLYSLGLQYKFGNHYTLNINGSKNFRIPTYNDLYWEGSGNVNLKPETSQQIEIGNQLDFKHLSFSATGFYNNIKDMIRWLPTGSVWQPVNTDHVETYGVESKLDFKYHIKEHQFSLGSSYAYTISKNKQTNQQLTYVPKHKVTGLFNYQYKRAALYYETLYVGEVLTLEDDDPKYILDAYLVSNMGLSYALGKQKQFTVGTQIKNLYNKNYQSVASRYMPGINYNFYLNFNF
ncbi:TonB-dependent receptor [Lacinutrix sp. C3R15]|uniref:TonB-dependent receptor plug domain-containing protein n=1 Tax=Flavobacteriaceae TaxID=49546 RepID=UPI001C08FDBF|nr:MULTISPECIES: TonB-dependent receptor [Flavobacteriaceae]MBU2938869.1 TonB-dependent receptor [Lacinutrix sp. C3R15]MDO6622182.1 TonB-dependent receptor [Oceanihabitans sp. 1_MG-2023]